MTTWSPLEFLTTVRDRPGLSVAARALLSVLVTYASRRDGSCFPTQTTLADKLGITERGVRKVLTELMTHGVLVTQRRGGHLSSVYRLRAEPLFRSSDPADRNHRSALGGLTGTTVPVQPEPPFLSRQEPPFLQTGLRELSMEREGRIPSEPPDTIELTDAVRARCVMAGARPPDADDIERFLANARAKGHRRVDWLAELVLWMSRQKYFDREQKARGAVVRAPRVVQPAAGEWEDDFPEGEKPWKETVG